MVLYCEGDDWTPFCLFDDATQSSLSISLGHKTHMNWSSLQLKQSRAQPIVIAAGAACSMLCTFRSMYACRNDARFLLWCKSLQHTCREKGKLGDAELSEGVSPDGCLVSFATFSSRAFRASSCFCLTLSSCSCLVVSESWASMV